ncbi:hypothetical protein [Methanosarcina sp.]|uniref:hypothetical protein n=1 Tax=Methanosarcina sp. TaxID=2213 RepID=UPI002CE69C4A|nr:hypothetical protein [Methanosarcina sp.]HOW14983.1 hypothetical protein [Methanosarcina sp.]
MENKQNTMNIAQFNVKEIAEMIAGKDPEEVAKMIANSVDYTLKTQQNQTLTDNALKLYNRINKFVFVKGIVPTDPMTCQFHIDDKIVSIPAERIEEEAFFRKQYFREFEKRAPRLGNAWFDLIDALTENKKEVTRNLIDSTAVSYATELFEKIRKLKIVTDKKAFDIDNAPKILEDGGRYFVKSRVVSELILESRCPVDRSRLDETMHNLKMRKGKNVKKGGKRDSCWELEPSTLLGQGEEEE